MIRLEPDNCGNYVVQDLTTKNDIRDNRVENELNRVKDELNRVKDELEPTTKNDLGVDCISRKAVFKTIDDCNRDGLKGIFCSYDDGERFKEYIKNLPPVAPQEPSKGKWLRMSDLSEQEDDRYKCSSCGNVIHHKNEMNLYTFNSWCGRCGSDNGRHINYEVEE